MADWDRFSEDYDRIFFENPQYVDTLERMAAHAAAARGVRVLDLGCGTGNVTATLLEKAGDAGLEIVAIDPSTGMREKCLTRFACEAAVKVREGDALAVPAVDLEFDYIFTNLTLHHVPPEQRAGCAGELARVLAPGGTLVYGDMFCDVDSDPRDPARVKDIVDKMVGVALFCLDQGAFDMMNVVLSSLPADVTGEGEYLTTSDVWKGILEEAGFVDLEVQGVPPVEFGVKIITGRKAAG